MSCDKVIFETMQLAQDRAMQINSENAKNKKKNPPLRPYKCDVCEFFHLTSANKTQFKHRKNMNDPEYRTKKNEEKFLKDEGEYWEKKFGLD